MEYITRRCFLRVTLASIAAVSVGCSADGPHDSPGDIAANDAAPNVNASPPRWDVGLIGIRGMNLTSPASWLACDGGEYAISDYPELYSVIGVTYGGDGKQTFRVPDLRGRALVGSDTDLPLGTQTSRIAPAAAGLPTAVDYTAAWFVITTGR